jgi:hypothetical protein
VDQLLSPHRLLLRRPRSPLFPLKLSLLPHRLTLLPLLLLLPTPLLLLRKLLQPLRLHRLLQVVSPLAADSSVRTRTTPFRLRSLQLVPSLALASWCPAAARPSSHNSLLGFTK